MKKLIQIALIIILVSVLFQAVTAGSVASTSESGARVVMHLPVTGRTNNASIEMAGCFVRIKGVICVIPNVGWNT